MQMARDAIELDIAFTRVGIDALLNSIEENDVVKWFTFEELGRSTGGVECVNPE